MLCAINALSHTQQTQNICITFVQRRPNVFDVGPTLYKYYANVLRLLDIAPKNHAICDKNSPSYISKKLIYDESLHSI